MSKERTGLTAKTVKKIPKVHKKNFEKLLDHIKKNGDNQPNT